MPRNDERTLSMWFRLVGAALLLWTTAACAATAPAERETSTEAGLVACTEPRPQVCTMQYEPVCARIGEGDAAEWKTYASDCSACGDPEVSAYRPGGECE